MITYSHKNRRHIFAMNDRDISDFAEIVYLLKHTPPPLGYQRKPLTTAQQKVVDQLSDLIQYPFDYAFILNAKTGQ